MGDDRGGVRLSGLGMMLAFWVLFIGLGTWWFQGRLEQRMNPNAHLVSAVEGDTLTLQRNAAGHFVATGRINGQAVPMLLDTGATYVAVPAELARRLGLEPHGESWFSTANGRVRGELTTLDEIRLGGLSAHQVRGSIGPGLTDGVVLLGMSFLGRFDIRIRGERLELSLPDGAPD